MTDQSEHPQANRHLSDGVLRAYLDHEVGPTQSLRYALHLRRCADCRARRDQLQQMADRASQLIGAAFEDQSGLPGPIRRRSRFGQGMSVAAAAVVAAIAILAIQRQPSTHTRLAAGTRVEDICCFNLDGGTRGDNGLVTVSRAGQVVDCVVLYEDQAGTRAFSHRDPVRFVSQPAGCGVDAIVTAIAREPRSDRAGLWNAVVPWSSRRRSRWAWPTGPPRSPRHPRATHSPAPTAPVPTRSGDRNIDSARWSSPAPGSRKPMSAPSQVEELDLKRTIPGPETIHNSLLTLPGVSFFDDQGSRLQPEIEIRGFDVSPVVGTPQGVSVFLDGVRVNEPDAQEVNFDLLPSAALAGATVVRGPDVLFGRNSLGGTILLTTRRGTDTPGASLQVGAGSFGEEVFTATTGGKAGGIDGFLAFTGENEVGWRQAASANTRNLFATVGHQWGPSPDSGDIALDVLYAHDRIHEVGSLPESYLAINPTINYTPGDFFAPEALDLTLRGTQPLAGGIFRGTVFGRRNNIEQLNVNVPPPNTDGFTQNLSGGGTFEWTRPLTVGDIPIGLTVGAEYSRESAHIRLIDVAGGLPDSTATNATIHQDNAAAFGQAIVTVTPRLNMTGGLREDYVYIPFRDHLDPTNNGTNSYDRLSPELGATYQFTDDFKGFVAYKSGFRAPAPLELACASPDAPCSLPSALGGDPRLQPVSTHDYEAGFDLDITRRTSLDVDGFWTDVDNDIVFAAPNLTQTYFLNAPKTRRAGIEASGLIGLPAGGRLFASYSYVAATFQSAVLIATSDTNPLPTKPGDILPQSPLHRGRVGAGITRLFGHVLLDGQFDIKGYQGQYLRGDEPNQRREIPGYTVAGLQGHLQFERYSLDLAVENLLDRRFYTFGIESQNFLGPYNQNNPPNNPPVEPFLTPGYARRITVTLSAKL